jgi:N-acetylmuramoyl-L-alanine amidase
MRAFHSSASTIAQRFLPGNLALLLAFLCSLLVAAAPSWAATPPAGASAKKAVAAPQENAERQYQAAKNFLSGLEQEKDLAKERNNWLKAAHNFRQLHLAQKKEALGPPSLYMTAKVYRLMQARFNLAEDFDKARLYYLEMADLYPGHALADDALYEAAEMLRAKPEKAQEAESLYQKIIALHPQSDHAEQARQRLQLAPQEKPPKPAEPAVAQPATAPSAPPTAPPPTPAPTPKTLATVSPAKFWSSEEYSRIVIQTTAPVAFSSGVDDASAPPAKRLHVDFKQSAMAAQHRTPARVEAGLLQQVRASQTSDDTVRMEFDLASFSEYKIFSLNDPFRVIVDIHGSPTTEAAPPENGPAPSQPAAPAPPVATNPAPPADEAAVVVLAEQKKYKPTAAQPGATGKTSKREQLSLAQQLGLGVRKIVVDPGHGGKDPGAMAFGLKEKDIVLAVSKKLAKELKTAYRYEVVLTRTKDVYLPLEERTAVANTQKSDLFLSIHVNASADKASNGIETYFLNLATDANAMRVAALENATSTHSIGEMQDILASLMKNSKIDESSRLARFVQTNLISGLNKTFKPRDLGVKQAPFYVLIGAEMPAILAEISFITNPEEAKLLQTDEYLDKIAKQIAAGVVAYIEHQRSAALRL